MASRKYITLRTKECREFLSAEQQTELAKILETLDAGRRAKNPGKASPYFFTLNVEDKYCQPALEAYINAIDEDETNQHNPGVIDARTAAHQARQYGILYCTDTKLPS